MTDDSDRRVIRGEIIPAAPRSVSLAPEISHLPQGMLGMGLFARARYASEQKQFEAYTRLVDAKNALIQALTSQQGLITAFALEANRARYLPELKEIGRLDIQGTLAAIHRQAALDERRFENEKMRLENEQDRLLFERDRLRKARDDFNNPPAPPPSVASKKSSLADDFENVGKEIEAIEQAYARMRADIIERAGGEQHLSDDDRERLNRWELLRNKLLSDAMEVLI